MNKFTKWWNDITGKTAITELQQAMKEHDVKIKYLKEDLNNALVQVDRLTNLVKLHTRVDADISPHKSDKSVIICSGKWKNKEYVNVVEVNGDDFKYTYELLKEMEKTHSRGYYDLPYGMKNSFFGGM